MFERPGRLSIFQEENVAQRHANARNKYVMTEPRNMICPMALNAESPCSFLSCILHLITRITPTIMHNR